MSAKQDKKLLVLLDSHAILHRAYHALPDFTNAQGEPTGALYGFSTLLLKIVKELKPDYIVAAFDREEKTFREEQFAAYKGKRAKTEDALVAQLERAKDLCDALGVPVRDVPGFEADDIIGTVVAQSGKSKEAINIVIASGDMDTLQLVDGERVRVYTLRKGIQDTVLYDEKGVKERYGFGPELLPDYKGLRGDPSDNIPGVRGIGEISALKLIQEFGSLEEIYEKLEKKNGKEAFLKKGIKERILTLLLEQKDEAFFSKELGTIRRNAPIEDNYTDAPWKSRCDVSRARKFFGELGFKSLVPRLEELFAPTQGALGLVKDVVAASPKEEHDPVVLERARLAFSILDSTKANATAEDIIEYAHVTTLSEALGVLEREIDELPGLQKVYRDIELPLSPILRSMEERGIKIDRNYLEELTKEYDTRARELEKQIQLEAGQAFNVNSPKQLGEIIFGKLGLGGKRIKKTAGGAISTRAGELEKLRGTHPIIEHLLDYREVQKLLSTYLGPIAGMLDSSDRLHTHFVQNGAETGRMSSKDPNLQNIPIRSELGARIRNIFIAEEGFELVSFDYSQVELRVLAILSGDENLVQIFTAGGDIHAGVASRVFGVPETAVDKEMRRRAKVINFGIVYGMGVSALQANLGSTRAEAQEFMDRYFATFPGVSHYLDTLVKDATKKGYTETLFGRRRYFPTLRSRIPYVRAAAERMAMNAPIQGTATGDFVKIAMIEIDKAFTQAGLRDSAFMLLQVHDELVFEIKKSKVAEASAIIKEKMEAVYTGIVPVVANMKKGLRWGELK